MSDYTKQVSSAGRADREIGDRLSYRRLRLSTVTTYASGVARWIVGAYGSDASILGRLARKARRLVHRQPDFIIGSKDHPYMLRWYVVPRNRWANVYLHKICRDDDDRALHDHPWPSVSLILAGRYKELTPRGSRIIGAGSVVLRSATYSHRLELIDQSPCWTLFLTGPRVREWGFHCPKGWVSWRYFTDPTDYGNIGRGCGEYA